MKSDRFLIFILAGIGILAALAVVIYFNRLGNQAYSSENTPQGVVQNYIIAVSKENSDLAYQYLAQTPTKPTQERFQQYFLNFRTSISEISVQIGETTLAGDQASVALIFIQPDSSPFGTSYRQEQTASLIRVNGVWKITQMPFPFWDYGWSQNVPAGKPPQTIPVYP